MNIPIYDNDFIDRTNFRSPALKKLKGVGVIIDPDKDLDEDRNKFIAVTPNEDFTKFDVCGAGLVVFPSKSFFLLHGQN